MTLASLTLNIGDALLKDLLQHLWILEFFRNFVDYTLGKLFLLSLLDLAFIPHPRVEYRFRFRGQCGLLLQLVRFSLKFSRLLGEVSMFYILQYRLGGLAHL